MSDIIKFNAKIESVTYYNEDNNYHIMKFSTKQNLKGLKEFMGIYCGTLVGYCVTCIEGDKVQVEAKYIEHPKWGPQYEINSLGFDKPETQDELYSFLSAILTPNQTNTLYNAYPDIVDLVINDNNFIPDLNKLKGIGEKSWETIREKIIADFCYKDLITLLSPCDVTLVMIKNIAKHFNIKDMNILREKIIQNPYILYQVSRLGFKKVDNYALKLDPRLENSLQRARACIEYILTHFAELDGHSYIPISLLETEFKKTISGKTIFQKMKEVLDEQKEKYMNGNPDFLYLDDENVGLIMYYRMENYIKDKLLEIAQTNNFWNISYKDFFERMETTAKNQGFYLSDEQSEVVRSITENNITVLSGKAGCVDCDTEYFNGTEWKKMADYKEGDKVLSYNIDTKEAVLDYPLDYIKQKSNYLWHFYNEEVKLDQVLCDQHTILDYKGEKVQVSTWLNNPKTVYIPSNFYYKYDNKELFNNIIIQHFIPLNCNPTPYKTKDGHKYCFTMPLGTLILRRNNKIFITGNCGKTSVIKAVLEVYKDKHIAMAALSAKAAKRMREVTERYASTIHMLLGYENGGFVHNEGNLLPYDLLIIDECSMNNIHLFYSLLKATHINTKILLCGDFAQVPSIGVGAVFADLINTDVFNNHNLTKVYRQSEESYIVEHANIVREGVMPFDITTGNMPFGNDTVYFFRTQSEDVQSLAVSVFLTFLEKGVSLSDLAIVVPRKETVAVSCEKINNLIQNALFNEDVLAITNKSKTKVFRLGSRVINKKNDYKKGILNGDTGIICSINKDKGEFYITLDDDRVIGFKQSEMENIELGYAITVHSAQGSQYKNCIVALDMSSYTLLSANMIYTAMTRAVNKLIVISQPSAFYKAVTNTKENNRYTWLKNMLTESNKEDLRLTKKDHVKDNKIIIEDDKILLSENPSVSMNDSYDPFVDEPLPF